MAEYRETGRIILALPTETGTSSKGNTWVRQGYVLETEEQYPRQIHFELWNDTANNNQLSVGESVVVALAISSSEWNGKWFTRVKGYRVERLGASLPPQIQNAPTVQSPATMQASSGDDLPF